jgi:hypothetical protein
MNVITMTCAVGCMLLLATSVTCFNSAYADESRIGPIVAQLKSRNSRPHSPPDSKGGPSSRLYVDEGFDWEEQKRIAQVRDELYASVDTLVTELAAFVRQSKAAEGVDPDFSLTTRDRWGHYHNQPVSFVCIDAIADAVEVYRPLMAAWDWRTAGNRPGVMFGYVPRPAFASWGDGGVKKWREIETTPLLELQRRAVDEALDKLRHWQRNRRNSDDFYIRYFTPRMWEGLPELIEKVEALQEELKVATKPLKVRPLEPVVLEPPKEPQPMPRDLKPRR